MGMDKSRTSLWVEVDALNRLKAKIADAVKDDPEFLLDVAEGETNLLEVLDALLLADATDEAILAGVEAAMTALDVRRQRFLRRSKERRAMIAEAMSAIEAKSLVRPAATITMAQRQQRVKITDEASIPREFFKREITLKLDKKELEQALRNGERIDGAYLDNGDVTLTIRRK